MHHQRLVRLAVLADVLEPEAPRQVEVELDRRELPLAADRVHELHVDLRAVEGGFVRHRPCTSSPSCSTRALQRALGRAPTARACRRTCRWRRRPRWRARRRTRRSRRCSACRWRTRGSSTTSSSIWSGRAEDVRVVLREAAHAQAGRAARPSARSGRPCRARPAAPAGRDSCAAGRV